MSSSPHNTRESGASHLGKRTSFRPFKPDLSSDSDWLPALIFNAKAITAGAETLPFPYVKGVFGTAVFLLETIEKVQKNRESMRDLCTDTVDTITVIRDRISLHGDTTAIQFKVQCEEFEQFLQDVVEAVHHRQLKSQGFSARLKEAARSTSTSDEIIRFRNRLREVRSNFMLMATMDTNFQVQKVLTLISPVIPPPDHLMPKGPSTINNCPLPTRIFRGRQHILDTMSQYFSDNMRKKQGIFLLHGLGGAGKTQIALKFIEEAASQFTDIFLVDASTVETIASGFKNIAAEKAVGHSSQDALQWLNSKQDDWLLFLDNADDPTINLHNYLPQCRHGNILITSRNPGLGVYAGASCAVDDMEETDAVDLLLRSAAQDMTEYNKGIGLQIVKLLHFLPLAIVQAGAFISRSGNLESYMTLYSHNRARLLTQRPSQSHDNYAWTVYTTWQISFDQLSRPAKAVLKLCAFLHYHGISEDIFKNATTYMLESSGPSKEELEMPLKILSLFLDTSGGWDPWCFMDATNELRAYSLITFNSARTRFSIHPLVHDWTRNTVTNREYHYSMTAIVGMSLARLSREDIKLAGLWMLPHIDSLMKEGDIVPDFRHEYAKVCLFAGKPQKAEALEVMVVEKRCRILGEDHPDTLEAMHWLAWALEHLGKWKEAAELGVTVFNKRKDILGEDHPDTLSGMGNLGITYRKLGKLREAEELEERLLEKRRRILGDNHLQTISTTADLAVTYNKLGKLQKAMELEQKVLQKRRDIIGADHPETLHGMGNLGYTYRILGQLQEAQALELIVVEKRKKILGENHPATLLGIGNLASTYKAQGQFEMAEELELLLSEKHEDILGPNHPETLRGMRNLAETYLKLGRLQEAEKIQLAVIEKQRDILGHDHPSTLRTMSALASTFNELGRWQDAYELLVVAIEKWTAFLGENHLHTVEAKRILAVTYTKLGRLKEAEVLNRMLNEMPTST
ncbi:hypothetical protein B0H13DRAFT_2201073 [Mycena leptocephala]|nr:hypothetical protein B0H13DRAFT_2201073 [Mycena leptocephala]